MFRIALIVLLVSTCTAAWAQEPAGLDALTRTQDYEARRESSNNPDITKNGDSRSIEAGATLVIADLEGPGVITHFWNTINADDVFSGRSVVIRVYYDGNEKPSVEVPLGDFFAVGYGAPKNLNSAPIQVSSHGRSRNSYWRLPFKESIKVTVSNESDKHRVHSFYYYLDWQKHDSLPEDTKYFHAQYKQQHPAQPGRHTILDIEGNGHYVGTVYSAHQMELGWFGEGDDYFFIDGAEDPQLRGTGTEDYFNDAWGFREFSAPYHGVSVYEGVFPGDRVTAYRWHIPDPVPFKDSLRVEMEHRGSLFTDNAQQLGSFEERSDWISSVAFWYQYPALEITDPIAAVETRVAPYSELIPSDLVYRKEGQGLVMAEGDGVGYMPGKGQGSIEFDLEIREAGLYQISGIFYHAIMAGVFRVYLDGKPLDQLLDLGILNADPIWRSLDLHELDARTHTLKFETVEQPATDARNMSPPMGAFSVSKFLLLRLEDMDGYQAATKRVLEEKKSE